MNDQCIATIPILIGTSALRAHELECKKPRDIDLLYSIPMDRSTNNIDIHHSKALYDALLPFCSIKTYEGIGLFLPSKRALLTLYRASAIRMRSSAIRDKWMEGMDVIRLLMKSLDDHSSYHDYQEFEDLYQTAVLYTISNWGDAPSMSDIDNKDFFKDLVPRFLPHDELHLKVAKVLRGDSAKELFEELKADTEKVAIDRAKFDSKVTTDINFIWQLFKEELIVLCIERFVLVARHLGLEKHNNVKNIIDYMQDYLIPHFITNLCGASSASESESLLYSQDGFMRRFLIHNYWTFIEQYDACTFNIIYEVVMMISSYIEVPPASVVLEHPLRDYYKGRLCSNENLKMIDNITDPTFREVRRLSGETNCFTCSGPDNTTIVCFFNGFYFAITDSLQVVARGTIKVSKTGYILIFEGTENSVPYAEQITEVCSIAAYTSGGFCWNFSKEYDDIRYYTKISKPSTTLIGARNDKQCFRSLAVYLSDMNDFRSKTDAPEGILSIDNESYHLSVNYEGPVQSVHKLYKSPAYKSFDDEHSFRSALKIIIDQMPSKIASADKSRTDDSSDSSGSDSSSDGSDED